MIKGQLTGLRAVEKEDLPYLRDWRNQTSFRRNFREVRELSMAHQERWLDKVNQSANDFMFTIVDLEIDKPIGACGLLYTNWINRSTDFSFYIGKEGWYIDDKGYAADAANLLISYGFKNLNLHKIWMELYEYDHQKLEFFKNDFGFHVDGMLRDNAFENGQYHNSYIISLLHHEYKATSSKVEQQESAMSYS